MFYFLLHHIFLYFYLFNPQTLFFSHSLYLQDFSIDTACLSQSCHKQVLGFMLPKVKATLPNPDSKCRAEMRNLRIAVSKTWMSLQLSLGIFDGALNMQTWHYIFCQLLSSLTLKSEEQTGSSVVERIEITPYNIEQNNNTATTA